MESDDIFDAARSSKERLKFLPSFRGDLPLGLGSENRSAVARDAGCREVEEIRNITIGGRQVGACRAVDVDLCWEAGMFPRQVVPDASDLVKSDADAQENVPVTIGGSVVADETYGGAENDRYV